MLRSVLALLALALAVPLLASPATAETPDPSDRGAAASEATSPPEAAAALAAVEDPDSQVGARDATLARRELRRQLDELEGA
ncbi:MAG: hypothetical protein WBP61_18440, partial [Nocardioides sp.]